MAPPWLPRDPFSPCCDADLFWEDPLRAALRHRCLELLRAGKGVWLSGSPGSGRSALTDRLAADLVSEGRAVLRREGLVSGSAEEFLRGLAACTTEEPSPEGGLLEAAATLYERLLEAFSAKGPVPCFPGAVSASPAVVAELGILSSLRVLGSPLVALALTGAGDSPIPGLETIRLPVPTAQDLEDFLAHRLSACGAPDLLPAKTLATLAGRATGFDDALAQGRRALARLAFERALEAPSPAPSAAETPRPPLFDPQELDEVSRLLESLGPGAAA